MFRAGYIFKTLSGFGNFLTIACGAKVVESLIPDALVEKGSVKGSFLAGALSGAVSSVMTYPINAAHQTLMTSIKSDPVSGRLEVPSTMSFFKAIKQDLVRVGMSQSMKSFLLTAARVLPINVLTSAVIFSMINGTNDVLGDHPLDKLGIQV